MPIKTLFYQINDSTKKVTVIMANVHINHPNPNKKLNQLLAKKPQVLILLEAGGRWNNALNGLKNTFPYGCKHDEDSPFAMHVFSKIPLTTCDVHFINALSYIKTKLNIHERTQSIYAMHPPPPINAKLAKIRSNYLHQVAKKINAETSATLHPLLAFIS